MCTCSYNDNITDIKNIESKIMDNNKNMILKNNYIDPELQKLYANIDTQMVNEEIDKWIKSYLDDYIVKNITIQGSEYIKKTDIDNMLKDVLTNIVYHVSDLYKWYISLLINIDNEDDMIDFITNRLSIQIIAFVSKFNQTK